MASCCRIPALALIKGKGKGQGDFLGAGLVDTLCQPQIISGQNPPLTIQNSKFKTFPLSFAFLLIKPYAIITNPKQTQPTDRV